MHMRATKARTNGSLNSAGLIYASFQKKKKLNLNNNKYINILSILFLELEMSPKEIFSGFQILT